MQIRSIMRRSVLLSVITVALWGTAPAPESEAQCIECPPPQPPSPPQPCIPEDDGGGDDVITILQENGDTGPCTTSAALFTPEFDSWTYVFDPNNSFKISTTVNQSFLLKVDLIPHSQAAYQARVVGTPFEDSTCNPTLPPPNECAVYKVHGETVDRDFYGPMVAYLAGWLTPAISRNPHDLMLLRAPGQEFLGDTTVPTLFCEEITTRVRRHYNVGDDPGIEGAADGFSDYVVAHQVIRPASRGSWAPPYEIPSTLPLLAVLCSRCRTRRLLLPSSGRGIACRVPASYRCSRTTASLRSVA